MDDQVKVVDVSDVKIEPKKFYITKINNLDLITQGFIGLNNIVRSFNSLPGILLAFQHHNLCVLPNSKLNLSLRFTLKQSLNNKWALICFN